MLFNSLHFLLFFPAVTAAFFLLPHRFRWGFLLFSSYYFYMCWKPSFVLLILFVTAVDYWAALRMDALKEQARKRKYLLLSLASNLGLLFAFKYYNFFTGSLVALLDAVRIPIEIPALKVILPVGISFYIFQALAYSIDVYRGQVPAERHFGIFASYVTFFPQLVAGPISRPAALMPQFHGEHAFDYDRAKEGLKLMAWGFFQKVVIADRLSLIVNAVYDDARSYSGWPLLFATYCFAFQIYCDFSGYSDIAVGAARFMGFDLIRNFDRPYLAQDIQGFWRGWHISLTTWFRDYVFFPLSYWKSSTPARLLWLFVVFLLSGLWHGAQWTFVIWGGLHGLFMVIAVSRRFLKFSSPIKAALKRSPIVGGVIRTAFTFHLVLLAWVFFRANSLSDALYVLGHIIPQNLQPVSAWIAGVRGTEVAFAIVLVIILMSVQLLQGAKPLEQGFARLPLAVRGCVYAAYILIMVLFGTFSGADFIYFQF